MAFRISRWRSGIAVLLLVCAIAPPLLGCTTDPGGHSYQAYNESDQAVIATLVTDQTRTVSIPARSQSSIESTFGEPSADQHWHASLFDSSCRLLGKIDLIAGRRTIHIGGLGAVELVDSDHWRPAGPLLPFAPVQSAAPCLSTGQLDADLSL